MLKSMLGTIPEIEYYHLPRSMTPSKAQHLARTKACCELMINDYTRRHFLDGRVARLPTVIPRPEPGLGSVIGICMKISSDFMVIYSDFMVTQWDLMGSIGIYPLVACYTTGKSSCY